MSDEFSVHVYRLYENNEIRGLNNRQLNSSTPKILFDVIIGTKMFWWCPILSFFGNKKDEEDTTTDGQYHRPREPFYNFSDGSLIPTFSVSLDAAGHPSSRLSNLYVG